MNSQSLSWKFGKLFSTNDLQTITSKDNSIYEILQLLGYSSLLNLNPKFNRKIENICIINLLQGNMINYDISYIDNEQMVNYLKILTK